MTELGWFAPQDPHCVFTCRRGSKRSLGREMQIVSQYSELDTRVYWN